MFLLHNCLFVIVLLIIYPSATGLSKLITSYINFDILILYREVAISDCISPTKTSTTINFCSGTRGCLPAFLPVRNLPRIENNMFLIP
jgi:hypothetical protein